MTIRSFILTMQAIYNGEDSLFNKWCWENWTVTYKRIKLDDLLTLYTKLNSKQIKGLSVRPETIKLLEENIGSKLSNINLSNFFCYYVSSGKGNKSRSKYKGTHKTKKLLHSKEIIKNQFRSPRELETILANNVSDKGLISKIYKESTHHQNKEHD